MAFKMKKQSMIKGTSAYKSALKQNKEWAEDAPDKKEKVKPKKISEKAKKDWIESSIEGGRKSNKKKGWEGVKGEAMLPNVGEMSKEMKKTKGAFTKKPSGESLTEKTTEKETPAAD